MRYRCGPTARWIRLVAAPLVIIMALACSPAATSNEISADPARLGGGEMRYLEPGSASIASPVSAADLKRRPKFVIVRITHVENPEQVPLRFTVIFRRVRGEEETELGTFSLYPADRPGRFIVATQGKVEPGGEIIVELNNANMQTMKQVRIGVAALALGSQ